MERSVYDRLVEWKVSPKRKPLIVKGVRQCGKTYIIEEFAKRNYKDYHRFLFEGNTALMDIFTKDLDPERIIDELSITRRKRITPDTLIFFDEIQFCEAAISSLKYFSEQHPEYHIICAGSLLGVRLSMMKSGKDGCRYSYPVGKVDEIVMFPMDFLEFMEATGNKYLCECLQDLVPFETIPDSAMRTLMDVYKEYLAVGGMPEAVREWAENRDAQAVGRIHRRIVSDYGNDILKYAPREDVVKINAIWESFADQLTKENGRFFLNQVMEGGRASQLISALRWITDAGILYRIPRISRPDLPLGEYADGNMFKIYCCDMGILHTKAGLSVEEILESDGYSPFFKGAMAENFVCSELVRILSDTEDDKLYYWKEGQRHEVDFIFHHDRKVIPVEVKSGKIGRIVSTEKYIDRYDPEMAFVISHWNVKSGKVRFLPFYLLWRMFDYTADDDSTG